MLLLIIDHFRPIRSANIPANKEPIMPPIANMETAVAHSTSVKSSLITNELSELLKDDRIAYGIKSSNR